MKNIFAPISLIAALLMTSSVLSGCIPLGIAAGAAAVTGVAAGQEGGLKSAVNDTAIRAKISDDWSKYDREMFSKVGLTVDQGRVLLTGVVQKPEHRVEAVRLAWRAKGVKQVNNEIQVGNERSFGTSASDTWITSQLKTQMLFNRDIQSVNYSIDTVKGVVYLMGVAQNQKELGRVTRLARGVKGVKQVVSYVKLAGEPVASAGNSNAMSSSTASYASAPVEPVPSYGNDSGSYEATSAPVPLTPRKSDIETQVLPP